MAVFEGLIETLSPVRPELVEWPSFFTNQEGKGFDRLSPNGAGLAGVSKL